jgi:predicted metal-dependent enzyme (double-stranded beta helix superfamily)
MNMHGASNTVDHHLQQFATELAALRIGVAPSDAQVVAIRACMLTLARAADWQRCGHRAACGAEELVYPLHEAAGRPSLYLVSDGPGVRSDPHGHCTWAVIVGLGGNELNVLYQHDGAVPGTVTPVSETALKAFDALYLPPTAIHATLAADDVPTYHLHLYGRPLRELPPYPSRCFVAHS